MKREFYEISDDEWDNHNFKPSRVLKRQRPSPSPSPSPSPPPIESFAYTSRKNKLEISGHTGNGGGDDDDDDCVEITRNSAGFPDDLDDLEDAEVDDDNSAAGAAAPNRGRRFIIDDDDDEDSDRDTGRQKDVAELYEIGSSSSEEIEEEEEEEEEEVDEGDVVGRALHKCAKISAELKGELFGSSGTACERYSEVESSSVRIVTQVVKGKIGPFGFFF